jgi:hypothetical protein
MILLFTHTMASEETAAPELRPLFILAAETLTSLQDMLWLWLQRIERANHKDWEIELLNRNQSLIDRTFRDLNFFKEIEDKTRRYSEILAEMYASITQHRPVRTNNLR